MRLRTAATAAALIVVMPVLAGCATYEEKREECAGLIAHMDDPPKANEPRPDECADVSSKDYTTLIMARVLRDEEFINDDGSVNTDKLLEE